LHWYDGFLHLDGLPRSVHVDKEVLVSSFSVSIAGFSMPFTANIISS
jgi:hypothetical protein